MPVRSRLLAPLGAFVFMMLAAPGFASTEPAHLDPSASNPPVEYPAGLQADGVQGTVVMRVHVTSSGHPTDVQFVQSTGNQILDLAAENAVMNWHYIPAIDDGEPISDWATITIDFKLPAAAPAAPSATTKIE